VDRTVRRPPTARLEPEDLGVLEDAPAGVGDDAGEGGAVAVPVDVAVARTEQPADEIVDRHVRDEGPQPTLVHDARVRDAERPLDLDAPAEGLEVGLGVGQPQVAVARDRDRAGPFEVGEGPHARHPDLDGERVEGTASR
jgi:hypothetical protein